MVTLLIMWQMKILVTITMNYFILLYQKENLEYYSHNQAEVSEGNLYEFDWNYWEFLFNNIWYNWQVILSIAIDYFSSN